MDAVQSSLVLQSSSHTSSNSNGIMKHSNFPPHRYFEPLGSKEAICDSCLEVNTSVLNRCWDCRVRLCRACMYRINEDGTMGDGKHSAAEGNVLEWGSAPLLFQASPSKRQELVTTVQDNGGTRGHDVEGEVSKKKSSASDESQIQADRWATEIAKKKQGLVYLPWNGAWATAAEMSETTKEKLRLFYVERPVDLEGYFRREIALLKQKDENQRVEQAGGGSGGKL